MVDFKIVAVRERQEMAESLRDALGLTGADIVYDDREGGGNPYQPTKEAWLKPHAEGVTHRVVLNEDVQTCEGFKQICEQLALVHPDSAFSLFTMELNGEEYDSFVADLQTPYVDAGSVLWGCAIMMPLEIVQDCFQYIDLVYDPETVHESFGIHDFLRRKNVRIMTTIPGTVQHIGDNSVYDPELPVRRSTRFEENPDTDWTSTEVAKAPAPEWIRPKPRPMQTPSGDEVKAEIFKYLKGEKTYGE